MPKPHKPSAHGYASPKKRGKAPFTPQTDASTGYPRRKPNAGNPTPFEPRARKRTESIEDRLANFTPPTEGKRTYKPRPKPEFPTNPERPPFEANDRPARKPRKSYEPAPTEEAKPARKPRKAPEPVAQEFEPIVERKPRKERKPKAAPIATLEEESGADEIQLTFADLGLDETILKAISALGFETPTPIQAKAIPVLATGRDLIGQAQTGTGKTAAFAIPLVGKIDPDLDVTQALVLAPTRELAVQTAEGIFGLSKGSGIRVVPVYGGQPIDRQFRALRSGAHIVVGTPGRVLDHLRRGSLHFESVHTCVLDEADEMLALGFAEDLASILSELPPSRQTAFFSATMPPRILELTRQYLHDPIHVEIKARQRTLDTTNQTYYEVPPGKKVEALGRVLDMETPGPTIVFCRTRQETGDLCDSLRLRGYNAEALHGDMSQQERDRVLRRFKEGQADLLVATDVAARGLDIETVTHVINYNIPWDVEQYIHRIGRTGRAGRTGDAITLVSGRERIQLRNIERMIGAPIKPARIPTAGDIATRRRELFMEEVRETLQKGESDALMDMVSDLTEEFDSVEIAAAALHLLWKDRHTSKAVAAEEMAHDLERPELGMTRIFIGIGRQDRLRPGDLVGAITHEAGIAGREIGVIDILDRTSFVEIPADKAAAVVDALQRTKIRNRRVKVDYANR